MATGLLTGRLTADQVEFLDARSPDRLLEQIAHTLAPGQTVTSQIVASAVQYQTFGSWGQFTVSSIKLSVPTADASTVLTPSTSEVVTAA